VPSIRSTESIDATESAESAGMGDLDNSAVMELLRLRADSSQT
jgi:hypothetical protein